jgi:hypothetical protein
MQPFSPSAGIALVTSADKRAVSPVVNPQAVVRVARSVGAVASFAVGSRRGAKYAALGKRWGRGVPASTPVLKPSPNMAVKRDWPKAASVGCGGLHSSSPSLPSVAASPLLLR